MTIIAVPITLEEAWSFVARHHRHHARSKQKTPPARFAVACSVNDDPRVCGVAIVGNPKARLAQNGWTAEVVRLCTFEAPKGACSFLYGACWRAARSLGFTRLITYTLPEESGASLRGAGWRLVGEAGGGSWDRVSRPRVDLHPTQAKLRWEASLPGVSEIGSAT